MTPEEVKAALAEIQKLTAELRAMGENVAGTQRATEEKLNARISELEAKLNRPVAETTERKAEAEKAERKAAFADFLRKGVQNMSPERVKLLSVGDNVQGGYLAPEDYVLEIIKDLAEVSPVRQLARVSSTLLSRVVLPKRTGLVAASWSPETVSSNASNSNYGSKEIPVNTLTAETLVTMELLRDSAFNVEQEIRMDATEQFGAAEGAGFVSGDGVGKPQGFITGATSNGVSAALSFDSLIDLLYSVKTQYSRNGSWAMSRGILKAVRKLKDSNGQYLWQPSQQLGQPATIEGKPVYEMPDMAQSAVSGAKVVAFGDFAQAYRIVDRADMVMVRDELTLASTRKVKFVFHRAVGGQVVLPEALSVLTIP